MIYRSICMGANARLTVYCSGPAAPAAEHERWAACETLRWYYSLGGVALVRGQRHREEGVQDQAVLGVTCHAC